MYNGRYYWPLTLSKEDSSYAHQCSSEVLDCKTKKQSSHTVCHVCQNKLEQNQGTEVMCKHLLHQDADASMKEAMATAASAVEVSQTLQTRLILCLQHLGLRAQMWASTKRQNLSCSAQRLWSALPQHLRTTNSLFTFPSHLKTHLFRIAYSSLWLGLSLYFFVLH